MIDLKELKDKFNLEATFNLGEPKEYVGTLEGGKEILNRISLVLTQTFDAIGALPFRQLIVKGEDKKVVIVYLRNNFFGIVAKRDENVENILKYIYEEGSSLKVKAKPKEKKPEKLVIIEEEKIFTTGVEEEEIIEEKVETKEAEREKVEVKEIKKKEFEIKEAKPVKVRAEKVEVEKVKEVIVPKVVLDSKVIDYIEEIAGNYLGDFSLDIVSNVIEDSGIDRKKPTKDQVLGIAQSLKDAASLIIGPSKAKKLKDDLLKKIEEVE